MKPWKVQKFFNDVVYDLRGRRLLPVVILLLVALVAAPVLISRGFSDSAASSLQATAGTVPSTPETESAVVTYSPGIRNYKQRLNDLPSKDPFVQKVAPEAADSSQLNVTTAPATGSASTGSSSSTPTATGVPSRGGSSTGTTTTTKTHHFTLYHAVADVSFGDVTQPLLRHKKLKTYASLPNELAPVLIYLGSTLDQKRVLFAVTRQTDQLTGEGECAPDPTNCSLLALARGQHEDMVYVDGKTYRVKVNAINLTRRALSSKRFTK